MNKTEDKLVFNGSSISKSVNEDMFKAQAERLDSSQLSSIRWDQIRQLYILGCDKFIASHQASENDRNLCGSYADRDRSWVLVIGADTGRIRECVSRCSRNLQELNVRFTTIQTLDLRALTGLQLLNLSDNDDLVQVDGLDRLSRLRELNMSDTCIGPLLELNEHPRLAEMHISHTRISRIVIRRPLPKLSKIYAGGCPLEDAEFLHMMPSLRSLFLTRTPLTDLNGITFPPSLSYLCLDRSNLTRIPDGIRNLTNLSYIDLSGLRLDALPDWMSDWLEENPRVHIEFRSTEVAGLDNSIFSQPRNIIRRWLIERRNADADNRLNELKVVFLGDGGAGKSFIISRLFADGQVLDNYAGDSTPGIFIKDKSYTIGDRDVQIHFWDFGGQEILHSMHRMFLTKRTLYVVVLNARDTAVNKQARYWLHNIKSFAQNAPVLMVLNQMDQNPNASINESDLRRMAPNMTETVKISALRDSQDTFNAIFTAALLRQIGGMSETSDIFTPNWKKLKQNLQSMETHYIHGDTYAAICEECGVENDPALQKNLLNWFNDLGVSFCYGGCKLEDYVILRPDWLTNAIYIILFNKLDNVRNGIVPMDEIYRILRLESTDRPIRSVLPDVTYTQDEVYYVLDVVRKFRLSFPLNENEEFFPMLCDDSTLPIAAEYEDDPDTLEFRIKYDYLPSNVIHRLMVEMRGHLDKANIWRSGARFVHKDTGYSAVVKTEDNDLRIFVRGTNPLHKPNTYLSIIKGTVDQINQDMGLTNPVNLVVYKADGISEEFDYDDLIHALEDGDTKYRSPIRRRKIPIMDILDQTGHLTDKSRDQLVQDLVSICMSMQSQWLYWNLSDAQKRSRENIRNDYVREMLRYKHYIVSDQTRVGRSFSGIQAGLLDLDIRQETNVPWTVLEALNISGTSDIANWNNHLLKLLDHYNPNGLNFLFLVSYLECPMDDFGRIADHYEDHMRTYNPENYSLRPSSFAQEIVENAQHLRVTKCTYDRSGLPTTVYHILVRLGE